MKVSYNWLKKYVAIPVGPEALADIFPQLGLEVESVITQGVPPLENVVVGEILTREQHPNADRLTVCTVNVGQASPLTIVCGAKNHAVGHRVFVAMAGAILPGNFKIKKGKLRGVDSEGMMCSGAEIGLSTESAGLYILEGNPAIGTPINQVLTGYEVIYDLSITANRSDALCHIGVARDLAAYFDVPVVMPEVSTRPLKATASGLLQGLNIESDKVPYYAAYGIKSVTVKESPQWLKKDLEAVGLRPINNIVDITNWVMLETGQPLHAFDVKHIAGGALTVRLAKEGESIETLDGKQRALKPSMLVIADAQKPLAIAGVMGSAVAGVSSETVDIVLESAYFDPLMIRQTSRDLALSTDSAYRFERGVDPAMALYAMMRAIDLITQMAGGESDLLGWGVGQLPFGAHVVAVTPQAIRDILGFGPEDHVIKSVLERLGFSIEDKDGVWQVKVPSARAEVAGVEDMAEEFLRIYGTDKIPAARPVLKGSAREDEAKGLFVSAVSERLAGAGFVECIHYTLQAEKTIQLVEPETAGLGIANPLSVDQTYLRPSLIPGLLDAFQLNINNGNDVRRLFEVGHVFRKLEASVEEAVAVAFVLTAGVEEGLWKASHTPDFFEVRGLIEAALKLAGLCVCAKDWALTAGELLWQDGHAAVTGGFGKGASFYACAGLLNFSTLKLWGLTDGLWAGELIIPLGHFNKERVRPVYKPFSAFPAVAKDLAVIVDEGKASAEVVYDMKVAAAQAAGEAFVVEQVSVFDVYQGEGVPVGKKSLAINFRFRAMDRTLTDDEVNLTLKAIQETLKTAGYSLRA